jgi:hypothetical protein
MASPGRESTRPGLSLVLPSDDEISRGNLGFGKRTYKPNSVVCGHSSRRRVAADTHQRPTRRFRRVLEPPERVGPMRSAAWLQAGTSLPIWSCSMWGLPRLRPHGRSGALLPHHFTLTPAPEQQAASGMPSIESINGRGGGVAEAVSFLWHWPSTSLEARVPDVIRHTALRSSDFPPPASTEVGPAATARSSCRLQFTASGDPARQPPDQHRFDWDQSMSEGCHSTYSQPCELVDESLESAGEQKPSIGCRDIAILADCGPDRSRGGSLVQIE